MEKKIIDILNIQQTKNTANSVRLSDAKLYYITYKITMLTKVLANAALRTSLWVLCIKKNMRIYIFI